MLLFQHDAPRMIERKVAVLPSPLPQKLLLLQTPVLIFQIIEVPKMLAPLFAVPPMYQMGDCLEEAIQLQQGWQPVVALFPLKNEKQ
eukprot:15366328-Ditylum_brightwellii.AAC.2